MPFTFKLSARLARMKLPLAIAAAAFAACELPVRVTAPTPPNSPVVQVVSFPDTVTLDPDQTQQFVAYGRTQAGDSVAVAVSWSASGGTVTSGGLYTANSVAGNYQVTATAQVPASAAPAATATSTTLSGSSQVKNRGPMAQVILTPLTASAPGGGTVQFAVYGIRKNGDSVAVSVAYAATGGIISAAGLYTAGQSAGTYHVIATQSGGTLASTADVTISNVPVASVTMSPAAATVTVGTTTQLTATPRDANGTALSGRVVSWATSNAAAATVSASGLVTGVAAGSATITATSEGQSGTSAITVTNVPVASVTVSPTAAGVTVGATTPLTATPKDANGTALSGRVVSWATSNAAAATVSASGLVTGVAAGSATITATSEGQSGTAALTVTNVPVASVTVSPATASVTVGATTQLTATPKDANGTALSGRAVTWATSNAAAATVSASGLVTGVAAGSATITATSEGKSGTSAITVTNVPVASVTVTPATANLLVGSTLQLTATLKDALGNPLSGRVVTWASNAPGVTAVSGTGLVTGLGIGGVTITATSEGQSGSSAVTVSLVNDPTPLYTLGNGNNYYVAPTGSDGNPCTATAPCYTLQRVSQLMSPGDNAHVASGNYTWSYSANRVTKSGTASALISYISDTKWGAKVYGTDCAPIANNGDYVQIINFDVTGSCPQGITTNGNYSKVIGNRVHDMPGSSGGYGGIVAPCCNYMAVTGIQIIGNVVDNIGPWGQVNLIHGIYVASPYAVVENNIVTRGAAACIQSYHGATHQIISNNTVANCGRYGITISADPALTTNDYTTVDNNIIVNSGGYGIFQGYSLGSHNVFSNNILYNTPSGDISSPESGTSAIQSGNITLTSTQFTALFVNYTGDITGDYHLRSGAVAIDRGTILCVAGVSLCVPLLDFAGIARPQGAAYDIGAYEWH